MIFLFLMMIVVVDMVWGARWVKRPAHNLALSAFYILLGLSFGGWIYMTQGEGAAHDYWLVFLLEKSLSLDNLIVIAVIFKFFHVPSSQQRRVLTYGLLSVVVLRGVLIFLGGYLLESWNWMLDVFAVLLIMMGGRMLGSHEDSQPCLGALQKIQKKIPWITDQKHSETFWVRYRGRWRATSLLIALLCVEGADMMFALDSIPAAFSITQSTDIVYTANIFAVIGLRSLYGTMSAWINRISWMHKVLAILLIGMGLKTLADRWLFSCLSLLSL